VGRDPKDPNDPYPTDCEDHDYRYESHAEWAVCYHCGKPAPEDHYDNDEELWHCT
jgi:hypothetical protein